MNATGQVQRRTTPADPYIYHHKWLFVDDDYRGFDVAESKARSVQWIGLGDVDRSRIGRKSYWENYVVPRLKESGESPQKATLGPPQNQWVRSAEARKVLKLSTCDLAHKRESGEIEARKVGNSYLYKLPHLED